MAAMEAQPLMSEAIVNVPPAAFAIVVLALSVMARFNAAVSACPEAIVELPETVNPPGPLTVTAVALPFISKPVVEERTDPELMVNDGPGSPPEYIGPNDSVPIVTAVPANTG